MTSNEMIGIIGKLALEAMLLEVSATPKPGLVDRNNSGAHKDMDFLTFMKSAASLAGSFVDFAKEGFSGGMNDVPPVDVFPSVRKIGIEAERKMFLATGGINTHKGEIFSLGLLSACAGYLAGSRREVNADEVMRLAAEMCAGICKRDFAGVSKKSPGTLTKGEQVYLELGITGIRGEAESGYLSVRESSLPALRKYISSGLSLNDAMSMTLIHIMSNAQDTNIISRHNIETAQEVVRTAKKMIESGFGLDDIRRLDDEFITRWISPGGSGDLLAVTYFLFKLFELPIRVRTSQ
ncbi:MAG: triphosphoribosyl-dephospho-CoA synthase CitG [Synergistaceae bacterium]|nr:triphosphoribosyl-dephospho-CoA synthase CitG [Synergistaceae bacterium]